MRRFIICGIVAVPVVLGLSGCAAGSSRSEKDRIGSALHQPLDDLNIDATDIPAKLAEARNAPYVAPAPPTCEAIAAEVLELDSLLGPDLDAPVGKDDRSKSRDAMIDNMAHSAASSWIPFRGAVRWVTGADRYSRRLAEARLGGAIRRGYLKGLGDEKGCARPALLPGAAK